MCNANGIFPDFHRQWWIAFVTPHLKKMARAHQLRGNALSDRDQAPFPAKSRYHRRCYFFLKNVWWLAANYRFSKLTLERCVMRDRNFKSPVDALGRHCFVQNFRRCKLQPVMTTVERRRDPQPSPALLIRRA